MILRLLFVGLVLSVVASATSFALLQLADQKGIKSVPVPVFIQHLKIERQ